MSCSNLNLWAAIVKGQVQRLMQIGLWFSLRYMATIRQPTFDSVIDIDLSGAHNKVQALAACTWTMFFKTG